MPTIGWKSWQPMRAEKKSCWITLAKLIQGTTSRVSARSILA